MKQTAIVLFAIVLAVSALGAFADNLATLDTYRQTFEEIDAICEATPQPKLGGPTFQADLAVWSDLKQQRQAAFTPYLFALFEAWYDNRNDADQRQEYEMQILRLHEAETTALTVAGRKQRQLFASKARNYLIQPDLPRRDANFLALLCTPGLELRHQDRKAQRGHIGEPMGWDLQDTYVLALMRAGRFDEARLESDRLLRKARLGKAMDRYSRQFSRQRALLEANAGDKAAAVAYAGRCLPLTDSELEADNRALGQQLQAMLEKWDLQPVEEATATTPAESEARSNSPHARALAMLQGSAYETFLPELALSSDVAEQAVLHLAGMRYVELLVPRRLVKQPGRHFAIYQDSEAKLKKLLDPQQLALYERFQKTRAERELVTELRRLCEPSAPLTDKQFDAMITLTHKLCREKFDGNSACFAPSDFLTLPNGTDRIKTLLPEMNRFHAELSQLAKAVLSEKQLLILRAHLGDVANLEYEIYQDLLAASTHDHQP